MYKKHNKQCMLGKQFNTGVSIKYIIFVIKPESPFKEIEFLNILVGQKKYIKNVTIIDIFEHKI